MFVLADTGAGLNLGNIYYHQSVAERHPNLMLKSTYFKDLKDEDPFNISGLDEEKESEQGKGGVDVIAVISTPTFPYSLYFTPSNPLILNGSTSSRSSKYANFNTKLGWRSANDWWY